MHSPSVIFVIGGVMSSLGKGITTATLGALLKSRGFSVWLLKLDPYLNVDAGTLSPAQHGETFVTSAGCETDLDLGHYERFTGNTNSGWCSAGSIYQNLIVKERQGRCDGHTLQIIPHVTEAIKATILDCPEGTDFILCEIGGTVGDIEGLAFLEAARQLRGDIGVKRCLFLHLSWVPYLTQVKELKTKLVQHSVMALQHLGIQSDIILCRADRHLPDAVRQKIALFCNVSKDNVIEALDVDTIYAVPQLYHAAGLDRAVLHYFGIEDAPDPDLSSWKRIVDAVRFPKHRVRIGVLGKYTHASDAYKSVCEALQHAGIQYQCSVEIEMIDAEYYETQPSEALYSALSVLDGVVIPGGYGIRGTEGIISGLRCARELGMPTFGICFGMQLMVVEALRHLGSIPDATSSEFECAGTPVVAMVSQWMEGEVLRTYESHRGWGGTMRLGAQTCKLMPDSKIHKIYREDAIKERHRHRYEINNMYLEALLASGLYVGGRSQDLQLIETVERTDHPWYIGVQFHPEFASRPFAAHPLYVNFVKTCMDRINTH
jgi:CTP synthase